MSHSTRKATKENSTLTPAARRAVRTLLENPNIAARTFGLLMWPDSFAHRQWAGKGQQGVAQGRAMWLKAGSYLHYLRLPAVRRAHYPGRIAASTRYSIAPGRRTRDTPFGVARV